MQYTLCISIKEIKSNQELKENCIAVRLQLILAFNQLRSILLSIHKEPTEDLRKELIKWLRYMSELHKHGISLVNPKSIQESKSGIKLIQIMEYQRINALQMNEAINILK